LPRTPAARLVRDSIVRMTEIVLPEDSNAHGSVFGGRVLALVDKCAAVVAIRHARLPVLTVALGPVSFLAQVRVGHILTLEGRLNAVFRSSMEVEVTVHSEDPRTGARKLTTRALVIFVVIDDAGKPTTAPGLRLRTATERRRAAEALARRKALLAARPRQS
jgi:acyl-CoA hydrolase